MANTTLLNSKAAILALIMIFSLRLGATEPERMYDGTYKRTVLYSVKGSDSLSMDIYSSVIPPAHRPGGPQMAMMAPRPAMIFLFGGGFYTGTRDNKEYTEYFLRLANMGYTVFAIDYRLGLKKAYGARDGKKAGLKEFARELEASINIAVEDLYTATSYILKHYQTYGVDRKKIAISGSSAGAIAVLQAEYYLCNRGNGRVVEAFSKSNPFDGTIGSAIKELPADFNYSGVISFAGAILNIGTKLEWDTKPAPIALFHGSADPTVPYKRIWTPMGCFNGSVKIAKSLKSIKTPYMFNTYEGENHSIAVSPMKTQLNIVAEFLERMVDEGEQIQSHSTISWPNRKSLSKSEIRKAAKRDMEAYTQGK